MTDQELFDTLSAVTLHRADGNNSAADDILYELSDDEILQVLNKAVDVYVNRSLKSIEVSEHLSYAVALAEEIYGSNSSITGAIQVVAETVEEILA